MTDPTAPVVSTAEVPASAVPLAGVPVTPLPAAGRASTGPAVPSADGLAEDVPAAPGGEAEAVATVDGVRHVDRTPVIDPVPVETK